MPNQLQFEKSPYLLQHKENPVNWLPWGSAAFEIAQAEDKPVFLSIGYSTCHWCHVMAHESFEDEDVAAAINQGFIPIKVDREERPDIDAVYMAACVAMTGSGGWPLTVLMTPEQKPFWTGTYLSKKDLLSLLKEGQQLWREKRETLLFAGDELTAYLQKEEAVRPGTPKRELVPHFEKMLYDNALLIFAYTEAFQFTKKPLYAMVLRRTAEYVLRELEAPQGGFYCGQDADSEGIEGKYYVFTPAELEELLGRERAGAFCRRYNVTAQGNFEGCSIPNLIGQQDITEEPSGMDAIRQQLRAYRLKRTVLHKDDKILTAWNGLMIAALAKAGVEAPSYLEAASRAAAFIDKYLTAQDGRLLARWRDGQSDHPGKLEDYAFYAWGLLELYGATLRIEYLEKSQHLAGLLLDHFFDREHGGLYPYASDGEQLLTRSKEVYDGAMPSGNAVAALVFSRLARLTGETKWREATRLQLSYLSAAVEAYPVGHSFTMLTLLEELWPSMELVCTADRVPAELTAFLRRNPHPEMSVLVKTPENQDRLSALAPFTQAYPVSSHETLYYLCQNGACSQPVSNISELESLIEPQIGKLPS